jgi:hypothetical protein
MSTAQPKNFVSDTGRILWGDLYAPQTEDIDGNPLLIKNGPDAGKPTQRYNFGLGVEKRPGETHWSQSKLGAEIWAAGYAAFPHLQDPTTRQLPETFAWKVTDGDSTKPGKPFRGKPGRRPCDKEGYPGHWVFSFSSSYPPKVVNADGSAYILDKDAVQPGDYVQVAGSVSGNSGSNPGVYLNHNFVSLQYKGQRIMSGPDPSALGFGSGAKPAGYLPPVGGMAAPPAAVPAATPGAPVPPPATPAAPAAPAPAPVPVVPSATFIPPAPAGAAPPPPAAPAAPPAPVGPQMTPKAAGMSYDAFRSKGWTDEQLRANGYMV